MDLFTPIVTEELQHTNFRTITKFANTFNEDVLNEWARGFKDRDGKFAKEFQTTFDSSFWKLYLFAVMKHFHLDVDFSFNAPDFVITNHGGMSVETTVASHAQGSTPESVKPGAPIPDDLNEFNSQTIIRISNSLDPGTEYDSGLVRHSLSNWLVNKAKVEPKTVQGILRHSRILTTLDLYTQDDSDETRAAQGEYLTALGVGTRMVQ